MKAKKISLLIASLFMITGCVGNDLINTSAIDADVNAPSADPSKAITADSARMKALNTIAAQKKLEDPTIVTLKEKVDSKESKNGRLVENYVYNYELNLNKENGYYHTHLQQEAVEWNNTLGKPLNYVYDINVYIWTDEAYRTTMVQEYYKECEGVCVRDEKIYAVWNMGYYQDGSTLFGTGKLAATKEILRHFFSGSADEGETFEERDNGDYNVSTIGDTFKGAEELSECLSAASNISSGKPFSPYSDVTDFVGNFYADDENSFRYDRNFSTGYTDEEYGYLKVVFEQSTKWDNNICAYNFDHRHFYNNVFDKEQKVFDTYSVERFEERIPDVLNGGYDKLDLTY